MGRGGSGRRLPPGPPAVVTGTAATGFQLAAASGTVRRTWHPLPVRPDDNEVRPAPQFRRGDLSEWIRDVGAAGAATDIPRVGPEQIKPHAPSRQARMRPAAGRRSIPGLASAPSTRSHNELASGRALFMCRPVLGLTHLPRVHVRFRQQGRRTDSFCVPSLSHRPVSLPRIPVRGRAFNARQLVGRCQCRGRAFGRTGALWSVSNSSGSPSFG